MKVPVCRSSGENNDSKRGFERYCLFTAVGVAEHNETLVPMTDSTFTRMDLGLEIFAVGAFLWASIDYNRFIKFWVLKPAPYTGRVRLVFRGFFLACVVGGVSRVAEDIARSEKSATFYLTALPFTVAWFVVFYVMLRVVEWMKRKREINSNRSA